MFCFVEQLCIPDCGEVAKKAEAEAVFKELLASCTSRLARTTLGVRPQCGQLKPRMLKIQRFWAYILDFYINILTYPPKYVVYRLSNITLPAKYLSIPIRRRYAI